MLLGDGQAARGSGKPSLVLDEIERFPCGKGSEQLSLPVHVPNRGRLHARELYALINIIFSDTNVQVYLHKKYCLIRG